MRRLAFSLLVLAHAASAAPQFDPVVPGREIALARDGGAHPGHRIEWWYVTGQVESPRGPLGFQVTFFRVRNPAAEGSESRFAPAQLLFAHAAVAEPAHGKLRHDQRTARTGFDLAEARVGLTDVFIDDWTLKREGDVHRTRIPGEGFTLDLTLRPTQPVMLQGKRGFSRKGVLLEQASYYYSEPQLETTGTITLGTQALTVKGTAWLDHEWSSSPLAKDAAGWDWIGANLDDGSALMAFRMRSREGGVLWSTATQRARDGTMRHFEGTAVRFTPRRTWKSPRTATTYPVAMDLEIGGQSWRIEPLMDDQELDARASTGTLYWEGAVTLTNAQGARGKGYLELTGYRERVPF